LEGITYLVLQCESRSIFWYANTAVEELSDAVSYQKEENHFINYRPVVSSQPPGNDTRSAEVAARAVFAFGES